MSKQGQHNKDSRDSDVSRGHNNPDKSVTITAGTPKKKETSAEQARRHEDPGKQAQAQKHTWQEDTREHPTNENSPRARDSDISNGRNGSDSNASR